MIPLEIITMGVSTLTGGIMKMMAAKAENAKAQHAMTMAAFGAKEDALDKVRKMSNPHFTMTRRIIALSVIGSVVVLPKVAALVWPELAVTVGYTEFKPGFLFIPGREAIEWVTMQGFTITPLDTHLTAAIAGLYFGSQTVGRR